MNLLNNRVNSRPERVLWLEGGGAAPVVNQQPQLVVDTGSGGQSGNVGMAGGFQYQHEDAYQRLLRQAAGQGNFRYNPSDDAAMRAYTRAYRREGDRATANALAKAAAATGGIPSSYAVGAAQQAGAYYASQMADKFPELEQQAYQRYLNERAATLQGLEALSADREDAYSKYLKQQAMEQQAAQDDAKQQLDNSTGVSQATKDYVSQNTNGTMQVTDPYWWAVLLEENTEEQLKAAGITYTGP